MWPSILAAELQQSALFVVATSNDLFSNEEIPLSQKM